jgi:hypothetical protein
MSGEIIPVRILVDWNNVQARILPEFHRNPSRFVPEIVLKVQQEVAALLFRVDAAAKFRVALRIYYGWHSKRDPTPARRLFERHQFDQSFARRFGNVSFSRGFEFGNELCCYEESFPLYDTYRGKGQKGGQKMVDTAITCDLLHLGRFFPSLIGIVISDDDDFMPAVITCRRWRARSYLLRVEERNLRDVTDDEIDDSIFYWRSL